MKAEPIATIVTDARHLNTLKKQKKIYKLASNITG